MRYATKRRTFTKKEAKHFVCNKCRRRFQTGDKAHSTGVGAYRHDSCPPLPTITGSSKWGDA